MVIKDYKKLKLPDVPGVYFFRDNKKGILYIGKATSLKDRVKSYFGRDIIFTRGPVIEKMVAQSKSLTWIETDSVLEAFILETNLIKEHQPKANVQQKDDKSFNFVVITKEKFPRVLLSRGKDVPRDFPSSKRLYIVGPFPQGGVLKEGMKIIRKIFPFRDKCEPLAPGNQGKPCFNRQLGLCPGVCMGEITEADYKKTIRNLILFFEGKKAEVLKNLSGEMKAYAKKHEFEKAERTKRTIFALEHIRDISLIKEEPGRYASGGFRIEAYDIAHLGGKDMTGVMVVVEDGVAKKSDYRKFKIRTIAGSDDTGALKEMLVRRLGHFEWPLPNLIVVDGSTAQINVAKKVLTERGFSIDIVAVTKDERHRPKELMGRREYVEKYESAILLANSEAHRFAIAYHKKLRRRTFLPR